MIKIKEILKDIWRNFKFPLIIGLLMFIAITTYVTDFDESDIHWYYISIVLCSGGGVACIIYGIIKYLKK